jgi:hypothetical protein
VNVFSDWSGDYQRRKTSRKPCAERWLTVPNSLLNMVTLRLWLVLR